MCLSNATKIKQIDEDIVCYKIVKKTSKGTLISPFHSKKKWKIGRTESLKERLYSPVTCNGNIHDGAYHTFKN